jgi:hypothetical protein
MLVQHDSLGVGKVVAIEPDAVHVFFPRGDKRHAAKFHLGMAHALLSAEGVARDEWLAGLEAFALDEGVGRYALAASWMTHEQAVASFRANHPGGFGGAEAGPGARCAAWRAAAAAWASALDGGALGKLLDAGELGELGRRAAGVLPCAGPLAGTLAAGTLAEALRDERKAARFFEALLAVVSVASPARARFERLFAAAEALEVEPALAWPIATLFPFLAAPGRSAFLSPETASAAADRLGCNLRLTPGPSWGAYSALRTLELKLLRDLQATGARDLVDVEVFLHALASDPRRAPAARSGRVPPGAARRRAPIARTSR